MFSRKTWHEKRIDYISDRWEGSLIHTKKNMFTIEEYRTLPPINPILDKNKWEKRKKMNYWGIRMDPSYIFENAYLEITNYKKINFRFTHFPGAFLRNTDLRFTNFDFADLKGADLRDSILHTASFVFTNLKYVRFDNADLTSARSFNSASCDFADFCNAVLERADLRQGFFNWVDFTGANLKGCHLEDLEFRNCNFEDADLRGAHLQGTKFKKCQTKNARFD